MEKQVKKHNKTKFLMIMLSFLFICSFFCGFSANSVVAFADDTNTTYTNVLEDLQKDESFDISDYPVKEHDGSLQVIQLAESKERELLVYVYQPSCELLATRVNLSIDQGESYNLYDLVLLSWNGVFFKYKLLDFKVLNEETRYYNLASIYRYWDNDYDGENKIELEKSFKVGQSVKAVGFDDFATFEYENVNIVQISAKVVANVVSVKDKPFSWMYPGSNGFCSHIVAFSADMPIEQLMEAEVYATYHYETYVLDSWGLGFVPEDRTDPEYHKNVNVRYDQVTSVSKGKRKYEFNRIMRTADYLKVFEGDEIITDSEFKKYDWVLCLSEARDFKFYTYNAVLSGYTQVLGTLIDEASILKLKFDTGGIIYNLGVVDNLSKSVGYVKAESWLNEFLQVLKWLGIGLLIVAGIALLGLLMSLLPIVAPIGNAILKGFKAIFKGLWWTITIPYQILTKEET